MTADGTYATQSAFSVAQTAGLAKIEEEKRYVMSPSRWFHFDCLIFVSGFSWGFVFAQLFILQQSFITSLFTRRYKLHVSLNNRCTVQSDIDVPDQLKWSRRFLQSRFVLTQGQVFYPRSCFLPTTGISCFGLEFWSWHVSVICKFEQYFVSITKL